MTLGMVGGFALLHLVMIVVTLLATWLGGDAGTFADTVASTPLAGLVGDRSDYGDGSLERSTFENSTNQLFGPVKTFYNLFSFEYTWLESDGIVGMIGTLLTMVGHLLAAWLIYQVARAAVGGFLSFFNR